jgi:hypothetical protein
MITEQTLCDAAALVKALPGHETDQLWTPEEQMLKPGPMWSPPRRSRSMLVVPAHQFPSERSACPPVTGRACVARPMTA